MQEPVAYSGNNPYIFVSYAHKNAGLVMPFISALQEKYNVWFDEGIHYGEEWEEEITQKLIGCHLFLYMITEDSLRSTNCQDEIHYARNNGKPFVNVVLTRDVKMDEKFKLRYGRFQVCKLYTFDTPQAAIIDLARKCKHFEPTAKLTDELEDTKQVRYVNPDDHTKREDRPYTAPPRSLLKDYPLLGDGANHEAVSQSIEEVLASHNIKVQVVGYFRGPTFTQYAVQLGEGVRYQHVCDLASEIAHKLHLPEEEINIVPKVSNMDAIGVEITNEVRSCVGLKSLLVSNKFRENRKLYFPLGVDVLGNPYYCDVLSAPHMLIAGSSGSGKSVCLNTLLCSILFNYRPDYVKFILLDPYGGYNMGVYNNLPHNLLGRPVVTLAHAIKTLDWALQEMERRYALMRDLEVHRWDEYNAKLMAKTMLYGDSLQNQLQRKPYIILIIDELLGFMVSNKKIAADLETRIARLTSKARAAGIHVVLTTQRPAAGIISGVIKNNMPMRVAFKTTNQIDSKAILEKDGAEKLCGKGDMYLMNSQFNELKRLQGPFVSDDEVVGICEYIRANNGSKVDKAAVRYIFEEEQVDDKKDEATTEEREDELFIKAVIAASRQGFVSSVYLQHLLFIDWDCAERLLDRMVACGFIEEKPTGANECKVLITPEECDRLIRGT